MVWSKQTVILTDGAVAFTRPKTWMHTHCLNTTTCRVSVIATGKKHNHLFSIYIILFDEIIRLRNIVVLLILKNCKIQK